MGKKWKKLLRIRRNEAKQQEAVAVAAPVEPVKVAKKVQPKPAARVQKKAAAKPAAKKQANKS